MYLAISLIISFVFAFALANVFNFFITLLISFAAALMLLTFIDTLITSKNLAFKAGCRMISSGSLWAATWWLDLLPIWLFLIVGLVGGIVTAPIWYFVSHTQLPTIKKIVLPTVITCVSVVAFGGIILLINPMAIYRMIHYGWVIGIFIAVAVISFVITIVMKSKGMIKSGSSAILIISSILLIPLMIGGILASTNATYEIYTAADMNVFGNAPTSYNTLFTLESDIDFEGEDVSWFGGQKEFKGVFDGKGHTLSNITVETKNKSMNDSVDGNAPQGLGFVRENSGVIRNVNFEECKFTITPKSSNIVNYDMYFGILAAYNSRRGKIYNCNIINCQAKYTVSNKADAHTSLTIASNDNSEGIENVKVVNTIEFDESFYSDENITWNLIS